MFDRFEKDTSIPAKLHSLAWAVAACAALSLAGVIAAWQELVPMIAAVAVSGAALLATGLIMGLGVRMIAAPFPEMIERFELLAQGDHAALVEHTEREDCIGRLARACDILRGHAQQAEARIAQEEQVASALRDSLTQLADNRLDCQITRDLPPRYEELRRDFNAAIDALAQLVLAVRASAHSVLNGAAEIRSVTDDFAHRNERQANTLAETATAMNQTTKGVQQSAQSIHETKEAMAEARARSGDVGVLITEAIVAMDQIEDSTREINHIIATIDSIAFQTNLLALNAGVEAARAGDAGRGFAVVATEVRALAQRSAEAAKDIKALITASTQQVATGVGLVRQTSGMLEGLRTRGHNAYDLMAALSAAVEVQASNLHQVNTAVADMDRATQQNAAMVEQSTAAARSLADEAQELAGIVARFHTAHGAPEPVRATLRQAPPAPRRSRAIPLVRGNLALKPTSPLPELRAEPAASPDDWSEF
ncbi:methyl-accepting chemotaxis protein [Novosphingobium terrae]|uniref:methyl-accepting chemotaxis protein n=1 Tax=Novosphingobium terrae TaxID=2726189 RepID=UPI00197EE1A2|nr:methyl-accepting chemotaxis protein [Novosphingobium terrae]